MRRTANLRAIGPGWVHSSSICTLSDGERHLGHAIFNTRYWNAFDATQLNDARTGFKYLGAFQSLIAAKGAVENSVAFDRNRPS
jgi:hypothetical protein